MIANCFLCRKNAPTFGRFCKECLNEYKTLLYDGNSLSTMYEKFKYVDFQNRKISEVEKTFTIKYDLFLSRNLPRVTYADERLLCYGFLIDLDIDEYLNIQNLICLIPHSALLKSGAHYGELLRKYGGKKVRKAIFEDSGDFVRPSTDFIRYEDSLGSLTGLSSMVGGELSAFTLVKIPFSLYDSFMISLGPDLIKMNTLQMHPTLLQDTYDRISISILYLSTKISTNVLRDKYARLFEDRSFEFNRGFLRDFFAEIVKDT